MAFNIMVLQRREASSKLLDCNFPPRCIHTDNRNEKRYAVSIPRLRNDCPYSSTIQPATWPTNVLTPRIPLLYHMLESVLDESTHKSFYRASRLHISLVAQSESLIHDSHEF